MRKFAMVLVMIIFISLISMSCGKVVPPATTVIILSSDGKTMIHSEGKYHAYGRDKLYFVDTKLKSFTESLQVLCQDKVNMKVDIKWLGSFKVDKKNIQVIKNKVPAKKMDRDDITGYQLSLEEFYKIAMKDVIRAAGRTTISPYVTETVQEKRDEIEKAIDKKVRAKLEELNYPVETSAVMLSNIDFDESITQARKAIKAAELEDQRKAALAKAEVAQAKRDAEIAVERGKAMVAEAQAKAAANKILAKSVTAEILALKQWEVLSEAAKGPNNELVIIPYEMLSTGSNDFIIRSAIKRK